jgi:8-oxo-dGTP diphosphatase
MHKKAAVVVVVNNENKVLCLLRSQTDEWKPLCWGLPGGHIDEGEYPYNGILREAKEETNLDVGAFYCGVRKSEDEWTVYLYGAEAYSGDIKLSFEHSDYAWLSLGDIGKLSNTTPSLYADVASVLEQIRK